MEMKMITSAKIPAATIEAVVREAIERETGRRIKSLNFRIEKRWEGYGPAEREVHHLDGVDVDFE